MRNKSDLKQCKSLVHDIFKMKTNTSMAIAQTPKSRGEGRGLGKIRAREARVKSSDTCRSQNCGAKKSKFSFKMPLKAQPFKVLYAMLKCC